jgi:hypothetical protein
MMTMMEIICLYRTRKMDKRTEENEVRGWEREKLPKEPSRQ